MITLLLTRYLDEKKQSIAKLNIEIDSKITIEYKRELLKYWKNLKNEDKNNVTLVFYGLNNLIHYLKRYFREQTSCLRC